MLDKEKEIIAEKLDIIASKIETLYTKRDEENRKIKELEHIMSTYSKVCEAKESLMLVLIFCPCYVILCEVFMYCISDIPSIFDTINWHLLCYIFGVFLLLEESINPLYLLMKYRRLARLNIEEIEQKKSISEDLVKKLENQIANLETRKEYYTNAINNIDDLPQKLNEILEAFDYLTYQENAIKDIEDIFISELNNFLNEKIDYSKIHFNATSDIKEYKFKAHK